jgi:ER lumen protein retaining receptor
VLTSVSLLGISFKTQALYVTVFVSRYLDIFFTWVSFYNFIMKVFFISSSVYILYLMKVRFRYVHHSASFPCEWLNFRSHAPRLSPTNDPSIDTFRVEYLVGPAFVLGLLFNYSYSLSEISWSFSIFLEAVAILPQLFILQRTGEAETITTHYLAALGAYRGLYIPNWIYRCVIVNTRRLVRVYAWYLSAADMHLWGKRRYFAEELVDPISITAGLVQTGLYLDFFYVYFTKYVARTKSCSFPIVLTPHSSINRVLQGQKFELPA